MLSGFVLAGVGETRGLGKSKVRRTAWEASAVVKFVVKFGRADCSLKNFISWISLLSLSLFLCVYQCVRVYVYMCICMCVYVYVYVCILLYIHCYTRMCESQETKELILRHHLLPHLIFVPFLYFLLLLYIFFVDSIMWARLESNLAVCFLPTFPRPGTIDKYRHTVLSFI